jgi:hypothetical protein
MTAGIAAILLPLPNRSQNAHPDAAPTRLGGASRAWTTPPRMAFWLRRVDVAEKPERLERGSKEAPTRFSRMSRGFSDQGGDWDRSAQAAEPTHHEPESSQPRAIAQKRKRSRSGIVQPRPSYPFRVFKRSGRDAIAYFREAAKQRPPLGLSTGNNPTPLSTTIAPPRARPLTAVKRCAAIPGRGRPHAFPQSDLQSPRRPASWLIRSGGGGFCVWSDRLSKVTEQARLLGS